MMEQSNPITNVEYRGVPDFPGYRVGSDGSVWSCWRRMGLPPRGGSYFVLGTTWRRLQSNARGKDRYPCVVMRRDGQNHRFLLHRLVLLVFIGPCPIGKEGRHLDGDSRNNHLGNLAWSTHQENMDDKKIHGTIVRGSKINTSKLTKKDIIAIRTAYTAGSVSQRELARQYGIKQSSVHSILTRKNWKHI